MATGRDSQLVRGRPKASGSPGIGWGGGPEAEFGFAASFEGGEFAGAGVIPGKELPCGVVVFPGVEVAEEGGGSKAPGAEVENEVDKGVELALGKGNTDESSDGGFGNGQVGGENVLGLSKCDAVWVGLGRVQAVAVADGAEAGDVRIDAIAEALGFLEQFESSGAQVHVFPPKMKGRSPAFPVGNEWRTAYSSKLAELRK